MTRPDAPRTGAAAVRAVREVVLAIPAGRVLSYGDIAELAGLASPRASARILSRGLAGDVAWWRVVRADGSLPDHLQLAARDRYAVEGTPLRDTDRHLVRVDMAAARCPEPPEFPAGAP